MALRALEKEKKGRTNEEIEVKDGKETIEKLRKEIKLLEKCPGPVPDDEEELADEDDTAPQAQDTSLNDSTIQATLNSLLGAVQSLTTGLAEVQADNKKLRALHHNLFLPELRAMARLSRKADQQVAQLGLADSSASTSDSDGDNSDLQSPLSTKAKTTHAHGGKSLKSWKEAKITSTVLYPQSWPHCYLSITQGRRDIKYEELKLEEFVASYGQILLSPDLSEVERSSRPKHLVSLMYFSQLYEWQAVLSFHGAVLLEIECGLLQWGDSFLPLESRTLYGHLKATKPASSSANVPILFCRDYQRQTCTFEQDHYGLLPPLTSSDDTLCKRTLDILLVKNSTCFGACNKEVGLS
ncbi:uncharacterized protein [Pocillopora verrucosa]|uniref:uncharacterized protein n=1 Tax=Pocillopora verrucosa TaxID=203993 RepID=UPI003342D3DB